MRRPRIQHVCSVEEHIECFECKLPDYAIEETDLKPTNGFGAQNQHSEGAPLKALKPRTPRPTN